MTKGPSALVGDLPWWGWVAASPFLLGGLLLWLLVVSMAWRATGACFRRSNWVMKMTSDGLYLQIRSYLNHHFPEEGPTVVYVPFNQIEAVQKTIHYSKVPNSQGRREVTARRYLDLWVGDADTEALRTAVLEETARKPPMKLRCSGRFHHVPVRVPEPGLIRVEWRGRGMLAALRHRADLLPTRRTGHGHSDTDRQKLQEDEIVSLAEQGCTIDAVKLARERYNLSLTDARQFVDELTGRVSDSNAASASSRLPLECAAPAQKEAAVDSHSHRGQ